jgi:hypothetical protein
MLSVASFWNRGETLKALDGAATTTDLREAATREDLKTCMAVCRYIAGVKKQKKRNDWNRSKTQQTFDKIMARKAHANVIETRRKSQNDALDTVVFT